MVGLSINAKDKLENGQMHVLMKGDEDQKKFDFSVCLAPIFGSSPKWLLLVEFIEFYRLQGAENFLIYVQEISNVTEKVLENYVSSGILRTIKMGNSTKCLKKHRCRHELQLQDCIMRTRGASKWVATVDLDERIMEIDQNRKIVDFLRDQENPKIGENRFRCSWILRYEDIPESLEKVEEMENFLPMLAWHNTSHVAPQNHTTKSVVRPETVESMGVHGVQKFKKGFDVNLVDPGIALVR
ncbi:unnamed protein product [Caenorhabditis auriculariae]|uniref:Glycosyltransferase family 92 protein n=1 Tax=Caenorhabditis auriculariae TaxID=2777116 RepID=A0A8S1HA00_9PELO|nr:unnamed protein product [Caenorhabditis auriculariae]